MSKRNDASASSTVIDFTHHRMKKMAEEVLEDLGFNVVGTNPLDFLYHVWDKILESGLKEKSRLFVGDENGVHAELDPETLVLVYSEMFSLICEYPQYREDCPSAIKENPPQSGKIWDGSWRDKDDE